MKQEMDSGAAGLQGADIHIKFDLTLHHCKPVERKEPTRNDSVTYINGIVVSPDVSNQPTPLSGELPTVAVVTARCKTRSNLTSDAALLLWRALAAPIERSTSDVPF